MCRRPTVAVPPTAGHTGPALQVFYRLRTPCQNPVIANQPAGWCGNPYSPCAAPSQHGETDSHVASLLGMTVTRKSSCSPWGRVPTPRRPITHGTLCNAFVGGRRPRRPADNAPHPRKNPVIARSEATWQSALPLRRTPSLSPPHFCPFPAKIFPFFPLTGKIACGIFTVLIRIVHLTHRKEA